jgi:Flp pilus assembly protein TadB
VSVHRVLVWVLVALALLVVPSAAPRVPGVTPAEAEDPDAAPSRALLVGATVAVGAACLALADPLGGAVTAAALCPVAWFGLARVRGRPTRPGLDASVPLVLDLTAAALRAGRPPADALAAAATAADPAVRRAFERVAGLLRLGADPGQAWAVLPQDGPLGPVAVVAVRSAASGARLAAAFERLGGELRAEAAAAAAARAHRAGVVALAPLGLCFLPSFVLLGVVPVVVGVARTALGGLP